MKELTHLLSSQFHPYSPRKYRYPPSFHRFRPSYKNHSSFSYYSQPPFSDQHIDVNNVHIENVFHFIQFLILHDPSFDVRELQPLGEDTISHFFPQFTDICAQYSIDPTAIPILLAIQVERFLFIVTIGDSYFDLFAQTGHLWDFSELPVQHISSQPLILWAFQSSKHE